MKQPFAVCVQQRVQDSDLQLHTVCKIYLSMKTQTGKNKRMNKDMQLIKAGVAILLSEK